VKIEPQDKASSPNLVTTTIRATFSEAMNPSLVLNPDAFTVEASNGDPVLGTVAYDVETMTATFVPNTNLADSETYTITLTLDIKDLAGNALATTTISTFNTNPLPPPPPAGKKSGCFIATAAYGSYLDPHVMTLREFRDRHLLTHRIGRLFVDFYYRASPPVADYIRDHDAVRMIVRGMLTPVVYTIAYPMMSGLMIISILAMGFAKRRYQKITIKQGGF
jgi:hypothetical protein